MSSIPARLVLVPGLGLDRRSSAALRARIPAAVVHLPGMGLAEPAPSVDELGSRLLGELGEGPVVLVGHSQSCQAVAAAARDARVVGLVLLGPTTDPRLRSVAGLVQQWVRTALQEPVRTMPLVLAQWWRTGPRAMAALWRSAAPDRIDRRLDGLAVPVIVVRGTRHRLCPHDWAAHLAATAPLGRLVELAGAAHLTPQTHPAEIAAVLADYWPSVRPRTSA
jgi:pimeloyl-ACP methyl ester carboxylesterase